MKKLLALLFFCAGVVLAQNPNPIQTTTTAPSGACGTSGVRLLTPNGVIYTCQSGMWAPATGGSGTGCIPVGTANKILVSDGAGGCIEATPIISGSTITASLTGAASLNLLKSNNLSDLANTATARTNLGLSVLATTVPGTGVAAALAIAADTSGGICTVGGAGCPGGGGTIPSTTSTLRGDGAGNASAVTGTATDCVFVNGTSGACGTGTGDVNGPASATDTAITLYDGTTGKLIKNSLCTIDTAGLATCVGYQTSDTSHSGGTLYNGLTSGGVALAAADVAGTAIVYVLPSTNGTSGQVLSDGGSTTCPTLVAGFPGTCHLLVWTSVPLTSLATQAADTVVMNKTGGSAAPTAAAMPTCTTGADLYNTSTHAWSCVSTGGGVTLTPPVSGDWTAFNTSGMGQAPTFDATNSRFTWLSSNPGVGAHSLQGISIAVPSAPYTRYFRIWPLIGSNAFAAAGVGWADGTVGSPGKITFAGLIAEGSNNGTSSTAGPISLTASNWTNTTTFSSNITLTVPAFSGIQWGRGGPVWLKVQDDSTNWIVSISGEYDGVTDSTGHWFKFLQEAHNTFLTATQLVLLTNGNGGVPATMIFDSYN